MILKHLLILFIIFIAESSPACDDTSINLGRCNLPIQIGEIPGLNEINEIGVDVSGNVIVRSMIGNANRPDEDKESCYLPYDCGGQIIYPTPGPINIDSAMAIPVDTSPLYYTVTLDGNVTLTNTGKQVEWVPEGNVEPDTNVTGGVLGKDVYVFVKTLFNWINDTKKPATNTIDGKGEPLVIVIIFQNTKYTTFKEALKHRNGLVMLIIQVKVLDKCTNTNFDQFGEYLKKVQKFNSSISLPVEVANRWFDYKQDRSKYYSFEGSHHKMENEIMYYCVTVLLTRTSEDKSTCISKKQFDLFRYMQNEKDEYYDASLRRYPKCGRTVNDTQYISFKAT